MRIAIHQPHYLPWPRYFDKIMRADVFVVLDTVQYNKNGWQNRNRIKAPSGPLLLTVPVHASLGQTLDKVTVRSTEPWAKKHARSIEQAYRRAPYFARYWEFLEAAYARPWTTLNELNQYFLGWFVESLGIRTRIVYASQLDVPGIATERLVNLVKLLGGSTYLSGAYATEAYLEMALFREAGIAVELQEWHAPTYPQLHGEFIPELSTLDLLMNCGGKSLRVIQGRTKY